jgi:hypothetical protein
LPLERLIGYLQQLTVLLGDATNLHSVAVREGSAEPVLRVPKAAAFVAKDRVRKVASGDGTKRQIDAYNSVRRMVRRDTRDASLPAVLRGPNKAVLIEINPAPDEAGALTGIRQASTVDDQLTKVGGVGEDASLQLVDLDNRVHSGFTAKRSLAKELAQRLWEPVRLNGIGLWGRTEDGTWFLERMQVQSFEPLDTDESLSLVFDKPRELNVNWPDDANVRLAAERQQAA